MKTSCLENASREVTKKLVPLLGAGVLIAVGFGLGGCTDYGTGAVTYTSPGYGPGYGYNYGYVGVSLDDRPYYLHGPGYWVGQSYYAWRPGHWHHRYGRRVWVHGNYVVRP